jgi:hypothetical protein
MYAGDTTDRPNAALESASRLPAPLALVYCLLLFSVATALLRAANGYVVFVAFGPSLLLVLNMPTLIQSMCKVHTAG